MIGLPASRVVRGCAILAAAALLSIAPFGLSAYHEGLAAQVAIAFLAILGLNLLLGYAGQISLGQGAFMAVGGYTTAIVSHDRDAGLLVALALAALVALACGGAFGLLTLRLSGHALAVATLALAVSLPQLALAFPRFVGGDDGLQTSQEVSDRSLYAISWSCAAVGLLVAWLLLRGRTGRALRSIRDNELAASSSGITPALYKSVAFAISAAFAGVAGGLLVIATNGYAFPSEFGLSLSIRILVGAVVAGLGSPWGTIVGAAFVGLIPTFSQNVPLLGSSHGQDVVFGLSTILVVLLLPGGLAGLPERFAAARRIARNGRRR